MGSDGQVTRTLFSKDSITRLEQVIRTPISPHSVARMDLDPPRSHKSPYEMKSQDSALLRPKVPTGGALRLLLPRAEQVLAGLDSDSNYLQSSPNHAGAVSSPGNAAAQDIPKGAQSSLSGKVPNPCTHSFLFSLLVMWNI
jgi:hypothetical protein